VFSDHSLPIDSPRLAKLLAGAASVFEAESSRYILATHKDLAAKLETMEKKCDKRFKVVFVILRQLTEPEPVPEKEAMGFVASPKTK